MEGLERLSRAVSEAGRREESWLERIHAGLLAVLAFLDGQPQWASLILEWPLQDVAAIECTRRVHRALREVLDEGRGEVIVGTDLSPPTALIAELALTGVMSLIRAQMLKDEGTELVELAPQLMASIVVPYLGRGAARADLASSPTAHADSTRSRAQVVPIRPHPRIMLALRTIASASGLTNHEIAIAVGITDEGGGHTSRLLRPLEQRGLIENAKLRRVPHEPNGWLLTPYGHRVLGLIDDGLASARHAEERAALAQPAARRVRRPTSERRARPTTTAT